MTNAILLPAALAVVLLASAPAAAGEGPQDAHGETEGFFHELAVPLGILTLALLLGRRGPLHAKEAAHPS